MAQLAMSESAASAHTSEQKAMDEALAVLRGKATEFARLPVQRKAAMLRECIPRLMDAAPAWAAEGARARGLWGPFVGEEWAAGILPTLRMMRLLADSLDVVSRAGAPPLGSKTRVRPDGRLEVHQHPVSTFDKLLFAGFTGYALMQAGVDEAAARRKQAAFYQQRDPQGKVALVLGAGNVASIPPMDAFTKMFIDGEVCLLKMNPVNEWVGPILERIFQPWIQAGYLRIVYGGAEAGAYLCTHDLVDTIHITGSDRTHDLIVWGPPGPERDRRMAANDPKNRRPISSELGNVSPVAIVPHLYTDDELWFQAKNVVSMVFNNGSFNCNAAKMLVTAKGWSQRDRFLDMVARGLAEAPTRKAYYPGARDRYEKLLAGKEVERYGEGGEEKLAWAFVRGLDSGKADEPLFKTEPFCGILSETSVGSTDPVEFLGEATRFMNDTLWGTLNAMIVIPRVLEQDARVARAHDQAVVDLRYGTVAINHWPAVSYALSSLAWGGHPSATLTNIQSGLGWVHNTYLLDGIDKSVLRGPLVVRPKPPWFYDFKNGPALWPRMLEFEAEPSVWKLPGVVWNAL